MSDIDFPWEESYPGIPTVAAARRQVDPTFRVRALNCPWDEEVDRVFYLVGTTLQEENVMLRGVPTPRFRERSFYGLMVSHFRRTVAWTLLSREHLDYQGPGCLQLVVDASWEARPLSEVSRDFADFTMRTTLVRLK